MATYRLGGPVGSTFSGEEICMDMGQATTDCVPRSVAPDVWTQCARHGPGQRKGPLSVTNRSIIYRLHPPQGEAFLVLLNGLWVDLDGDQPFRGLRALEQETGARLRYILSPGASHHVSLAHYARAFPEAQVWVAAGRIRRMNPELLALDNVHDYPIEAPPPELAQAGLLVQVVGGLMEGPATVKAQRFAAGVKGYVCNATEPLMVCHVPTGAVTSGGHQWWFVPDGHDNVFTLPLVLKWMLSLFGLGFGYMAPGRVACETNHSYAIHDRAALQRSAQQVLAWDFDALLDLHAQPNTCPSSGARALLEPVLRPIAAGDWGALPWGESTLPGR